MSTIQVTSANFESEVLKSDKPVVVDFWAEWCPPCKMIAPALEELAEEMKEQITIAKLNVDEQRDLAVKFNIRSIPTLIVFKNGSANDQKSGALPKKDLKTWFESAIA